MKEYPKIELVGEESPYVSVANAATAYTGGGKEPTCEVCHSKDWEVLVAGLCEVCLRNILGG